MVSRTHWTPNSRSLCFFPVCINNCCNEHLWHASATHATAFGSLTLVCSCGLRQTEAVNERQEYWSFPLLCMYMCVCCISTWWVHHMCKTIFWNSFYLFGCWIGLLLLLTLSLIDSAYSVYMNTNTHINALTHTHASTHIYVIWLHIQIHPFS